MNLFIRIAAIFILTALTIRISDLLFKRARKNTNKIHLIFMQGLVRAAAIVCGIVALGMQFDVTKELSSTLAKNTALLVAVLGFAAQQTLNDILSGFMISWYRPFNIGERIHLVTKDITGLVEDITLRHTVIRCFDNNRIIIPNSIINKEILKNSDYQDSVIGNHLEIGIDAGSDIRRAMELVRQVITEHPSVISSPAYDPGILVKDVKKEGYLLKATVWTKTVNENFQACSDIRISLKQTFDDNQITML